MGAACARLEQADGADARKSLKGATGLANLGNTCYINATVQCLVHAKPLADEFLLESWKDDLPERQERRALATSLADLTKRMWLGSSQVISPRSLHKAVKSYDTRFDNYEQNDCQELLLSLLDGLNEDLNRVKTKPEPSPELDSDGKQDTEVAEAAWTQHLARHRSPVTDIFCGQLRSSVTCTRCGYCSKTFDPFLSLSVPLEETAAAAAAANSAHVLHANDATSRARARSSSADAGGGPTAVRALTLGHALSLFTSPELLTRDDAWRCPKCKTSVEAVKRMDIWRLPRVLVIHLKRFRYNRSGARVSKIAHHVRFPTRRLDLSPFGSQGSPYIFGSQNNGGGIDDINGSFVAVDRDKAVPFRQADGSSISSESAAATAVSEAAAKSLVSTASSPQQPAPPAVSTGTADVSQVEALGTLYDLFAVAQHHGTVSQGHYTAAVHNHIKKRWYLCDDDLVEPLDSEDDVRGSKDAYVLFYLRRPAVEDDAPSSAAVDKADDSGDPLPRPLVVPTDAAASSEGSAIISPLSASSTTATASSVDDQPVHEKSSTKSVHVSIGSSAAAKVRMQQPQQQKQQRPLRRIANVETEGEVDGRSSATAAAASSNSSSGRRASNGRVAVSATRRYRSVSHGPPGAGGGGGVYAGGRTFPASTSDASNAGGSGVRVGAFSPASNGAVYTPSWLIALRAQGASGGNYVRAPAAGPRVIVPSPQLGPSPSPLQTSANSSSSALTSSGAGGDASAVIRVASGASAASASKRAKSVSSPRNSNRLIVSTTDTLSSSGGRDGVNVLSSRASIPPLMLPASPAGQQLEATSSSSSAAAAPRVRRVSGREPHTATAASLGGSSSSSISPGSLHSGDSELSEPAPPPPPPHSNSRNVVPPSNSGGSTSRSSVSRDLQQQQQQQQPPRSTDRSRNGSCGTPDKDVIATLSPLAEVPVQSS